MSKHIERVDLLSCDFEILESHDCIDFEDASYCSGWVALDGESFYAFYTIIGLESVWIFRNKSLRGEQLGHFDMRKKLRLAALLASKIENPFISNEGDIPVTIAVEGKPAIASYLFAVEDQYPSEIAEVLDVSKNTIEKYTTRYWRESQH